jgi:hypothetical protein
MTDPNFERSLRAAARRGQPGGVHPDASLLAAYVDRGLSAAERAERESHVAGCAECMEHLALLGSVNVPDEPEAPSVEWSPRQLLTRWGWLVPVATVVVLVAVWERQPARQSASMKETPATAAAQKPAAPEASAPEANESARRKAEERQAQGAQAPAGEVAGAPKAKDTATTPALQARAREATPPIETPSAGGAPADGPVLRDKNQLVDALGSVASKQIAAAPAPAPVTAARATPPAAQRESAAATFAGRADEAKPGNRPQAGAVAEKHEAVAQGALLKSAIEAPVVLATGPGVAIRLLGSRLERSIDNGATWTLDLADAPAGLHVGACPNAAACWVGGAQGLVMLRQPSGAWTRHIVSDGRAGVTAIDASDATTATVHLSDGRSFRTADAGSTWELVGSRQ